MEIYRSSTRYIGPHHNILGPARFLPYESRGWRAPLFNFGGHFNHRPFFGGFGGFGGGMYQQNVIIDNGRHGFWGNLADGIEGFVRGFTNVSWLMGGMQNMFGMGMGAGIPMGGMPMGGMPMGMPAGQAQAQQTDTTGNLEYNNLKKLGDITGYKTIVKESDGTYTAFNPDTGEHISGDYETVKNSILKKDDDEVVVQKHQEVEAEAETLTAAPEETKPQGAHSDNTVVSAKDLKSFKGNIRVTDDGLGEKADIAGETEYSEETDKATGYNKIITIKGYRYELVTPVDKEKVMYKSLDGDGQSYRLEWQDEGVVLAQHIGDKGYNKSDIHS